MDLPPPPANGTQPEGAPRKPGWTTGLLVTLWLVAVAFSVQFAAASAAELEPQAAIMGWMFVAILAAVGGSAIAARRLDRRRDE